MKHTMIAAIGLTFCGALAFTRPAQAQWAVIDVGAITQLIIQVRQIENEIQVAQNTLNQAHQAYSAITGGRGMQLLLSGTNWNYLPANWSQLVGAQNGAGGTYGALGSDVSATIQRNAVLTPNYTQNFSDAENAQLSARRSSVALQEALTRQELSNVSQRFAAIQTLINAIPSATDEKGILDLQARIQVEQNMLENENSKLRVLYEAAQSQAQTERERADEQAIVDIGHLSALPPMGLQ
jgi:type IV secretion system protein VirB5